MRTSDKPTPKGPRGFGARTLLCFDRPRGAQRTPRTSRNPKRAGLACAILLVAGTLASPSAFAQITTTSDTPPAPAGSLRNEVETSFSGEVINVRLGAGATDLRVIQLESTLVFDNSLTLDNSNPGFAPTTIRSPNSGNLFEIQNGVALILRDVGLGVNGQNNSDAIELQTATSSLTLDLERGNQTVFADLTGLGSVIKEGKSSLELAGANDFSGGLTIREGDVIGDALSFGTSFIDLAASGASTTARVVIDIGGTDVFDNTSPMVRNLSTGGGQARFVKTGTGTLDIAGASIASSIGIVVDAGTLRAGDAFLANNYNAEVRSNATLRLRDLIAGASYAGRVTGAGTVDTNGVANFTGDLTGFSGTLAVGVVSLGPADLGEILIRPNVAPSKSLDFDVLIRAAAGPLPTTFGIVDDFGIVYSGDITGTGDFTKSGSGTTELTGTKAPTVRTILLAGSLIGNTNNLRGAIDASNGTTLGFRQATDGSFGGVITSTAGTITVNKLGAGRLTLATDQNFQGSLNVNEGGLHFAQGVDLPNASLTIGTGSPASIETLTSAYTLGGDNTVDIGGSLTFRADAQLTVDLDDTAASATRFAAAGAITIDPAARLVVRLQPGIYAGSPTFDILTGAGGVAGAFAIQQNLFFFDILGGISGNAYQIQLNPSGRDFGNTAITPNQRAVGGQLDLFRAGPSGGDPSIQLIQDRLTVLQASDVASTLDAVSPDELAASTHLGLATATRTWRSLSNRLALQRKSSIGHHNTREARQEKARRERAERLRNRSRRPGPAPTRPSVEAAPPDPLPAKTAKPWVAWIEGNGALGELDSQDAKGFDYSLVGPLIGTDTALTRHLRVGLATGMTYSRYETKGQTDGEGDAYAAEGVVYGTWIGGPVEALLAARYAHGWTETDRRIQFGTISDRIQGEFEGDLFGFYAELTRGFDLPYAIDLAPLASVAYSHVMWDGFDERGTSPLRMQIDDTELDSALTSLGFRIATEREMDEGFVFRPRFKALWNREWADVEREVSGRFASATVTGGGAFTVEGAEMPRDHAEVSVGWEIGYRANANLFLVWDGRFGKDLIENGLSVGARVEW